MLTVLTWIVSKSPPHHNDVVLLVIGQTSVEVFGVVAVVVVVAADIVIESVDLLFDELDGRVEEFIVVYQRGLIDLNDIVGMDCGRLWRVCRLQFRSDRSAYESSSCSNRAW